MERDCKFLRAVNISTLYVPLQGASEVLALSATEQEIAVATAVSYAALWEIPQTAPRVLAWELEDFQPQYHGFTV